MKIRILGLLLGALLIVPSVSFADTPAVTPPLTNEEIIQRITLLTQQLLVLQEKLAAIQDEMARAPKEPVKTAKEERAEAEATAKAQYEDRLIQIEREIGELTERRSPLSAAINAETKVSCARMTFAQQAGCATAATREKMAELKDVDLQINELKVERLDLWIASGMCKLISGRKYWCGTSNQTYPTDEERAATGADQYARYAKEAPGFQPPVTLPQMVQY